jgi:predicted site-specific integrase-resolvase
MPKSPKAKSKALGLTGLELCQALGVSMFSIHSWRTKGIIPFYKIGGMVRYDLAKVKAALERCEVPAKP